MGDVGPPGEAGVVGLAGDDGPSGLPGVAGKQGEVGGVVSRRIDLWCRNHFQLLLLLISICRVYSG